MRERNASLLALGAMMALSGAVLAHPPRIFHPVPLPVQSPRLLGMSMDADGSIWVGSTHRALYRYTPRTGSIEEIKLPFDSAISQTICAGKKVYLLGQTYPKLMLYDRTARKFSELPLPVAKPDVWYGSDVVEGNSLYLFDRGSSSLIKWDVLTDTGKTIPYPYKTPPPSSGRYLAADGGLWCAVWDFTAGKYLPIGIARLDARTDRFTDWFPFPGEAVPLQPFTDAEHTLFYPHTLKGRLVPFDFKKRRWCQPLDVPEYGRRFGFIGGGIVHQGRWYFAISTYNGTATGCDGKPYHFCNGLLEFDPRARRFAFPTLDVKGAYFQMAYTLSAGGHLFVSGNNILEKDGRLNMSKTGEAIFWQTLRPDRKER